MFTRPADTLEAFSVFLNELSARTMRGGEPSREEILYLLETPPDSPQSELMRKKAQEMAIELTGNTGRVWSAVGIDRRSCPMNCEFCSFGEKWGLIKDESEWPDEDVVKTARLSVSGGVSWFTLRTTEFYSVERLMALARKVRAEVPGDYALVVNTGELDAEKARQLKDAGVTGVYHTLRLGEGETTRFEPATRLATMSAVCDSELELYHMVEPLGPATARNSPRRTVSSDTCRASSCPRPDGPGNDLRTPARYRMSAFMAHLPAFDGTAFKGQKYEAFKAQSDEGDDNDADEGGHIVHGPAGLDDGKT